MTLETKVEAKKTSVNEDDSSLSVVEFLREVEEPLKEVHLPLGKGKFIYTSLLGTAAHLSTSQNIKATFLILLLDPDPDLDPQPSDLKLKVAIFMEQENIRIGRERFFQGIFTTNANR